MAVPGAHSRDGQGQELLLVYKVIKVIRFPVKKARIP